MMTTSVTEILKQIQKLVEEHTDITKEAAENCIKGSFMTCTYLSPDMITLTKLTIGVWQAV
jgi:hypothetical protein